jgi:magnesium-transporting ATPase (P-type)
MKVEEGMTIPTDCILIQGNNVSIDESAMTGEIELIEKATFEECLSLKIDFLNRNPQYNVFIPESSLHKIKFPIISSGTRIVSGSGLVLIIAVGPNSENGKIMATIEANKNSDEGTHLQKKLTAIATFIGKVLFQIT